MIHYCEGKTTEYLSSQLKTEEIPSRVREDFLQKRIIQVTLLSGIELGTIGLTVKIQQLKVNA